MTAPDELLPCPFCGGQPIRSMSAPYIVGCVSKRCPAYANVTGDSMSNATANWNRRYIRAPESAPNGLADELERLTKACHDANAEDYPSGCCAWTFRAHDLARYFIDNATAILAALRTKAGEGET